MTRQELGKAKDLVTAMAAMKRAAAMQTNTAIVVVQGTKIVRVTAAELRQEADAWRW